MAKVSITYRFASGDVLMVEVKADPSFPDALHELEARALSIMREVWSFMPDQT